MNKRIEIINSLMEKEYSLASNIAGYFLEEYGLLEDYKEESKRDIIYTVTSLISILASELQDNEELKADLDKLAKITAIVDIMEVDNSIL